MKPLAFKNPAWSCDRAAGSSATLDGPFGKSVVKIVLAQCCKAAGAPDDSDITGALRFCADQVGPAIAGCGLDAGGKVERVCFADI